MVIILGVILLLLILAAGGGPTGDRPGFRYWSDPGAFAEYKVDGAKGRFLGLWSALATAVYAFSGTELVGVTVGEAKNPRLNMPKAVRMTFFRILFFYIISVFLLGMVVPYSSTDLAFAVGSKTSAAADRATTVYESLISLISVTREVKFPRGLEWTSLISDMTQLQ